MKYGTFILSAAALGVLGLGICVAVAAADAHVESGKIPVAGAPKSTEAVDAKLRHGLKHIDAAVAAIKAGRTEHALAALQKARTAVAEAHKALGSHAHKPAVVNVRCPIMGGRIDPKNVPANLTRVFNGHKVAFCCPGCPAAWDKLSDAKKEAKLKAALPKHKAAELPVVNTRCPIMGGRIDPKNAPANLTRVFNGRKVAFCCPGCPAAWDKLSDAEKETKLQASLPKARR